MEKFKLVEIINIKKLQEIQDKFTEVTGLGAVITDVDGNPVTEPSNFTDFCKLIRSCPEGYKKCIASDAAGGQKGRITGEAVFYNCPAGLTDLAAPIIVDNTYMGVFLCGQVILPDSPMQKSEAIWEINKDIGLKKEELLAVFEKIDTIDKKTLKSAGELLQITTNYIIEMGIANLRQRQLMSEMKAKADLERNLRETEYKALLSQVNPHFLFNSLNTIARLAQVENAFKTQDIVYSLAELLRYSLKNADKVVRLRDELKYIKNYLLIQETRFSDRLKNAFDIEEYVLNAKLPSMTLQPIVENAIVHGIEPKNGGGVLRIRAGKDQDKVFIEVSDTGIGIPSSKIDKILREKKEKSSGQMSGLGIYNVQQRIRYLYGEEYGLSIKSKPNYGTDVMISLPYLE